ncbi:MAG: hypothetical protein HWE21_10340 [Cytophagia bacterium]|nr:hypothetical protein [Cytophagia bacterium]
MKAFLPMLAIFLFVHPKPRKGEFSTEHFTLAYPEEWVVRPVENTTKVNLILETEKFSIWSPLKPDEDRRVLKLTIPSTIYYKKSPSIKKINNEIWKGAKRKLVEPERVSSEQGERDGVSYIKTVVTSQVGFGFETTEYYVFSINDTPYVLYMTTSRKDYDKQSQAWSQIWSDINFQ